MNLQNLNLEVDASVTNSGVCLRVDWIRVSSHQPEGRAFAQRNKYASYARTPSWALPQKILQMVICLYRWQSSWHNSFMRLYVLFCSTWYKTTSSTGHHRRDWLGLPQTGSQSVEESSVHTYLVYTFQLYHDSTVVSVA